MSRPTLVTGAAGFAGSHLIDLLSAESHDVVAWHRPDGAAPRRLPGVRWQGVNVRDREAVRTAIREIRPARVFHCAGAAHVGNAWNAATETLATNVLGTHYLIEALRHEAPDARVLIPSTGLVYQSSPDAMTEEHPRVPAGPYGVSKLAQEMVGADLPDGPVAFIARPFNHVGPRQSSAFAASGFARRIAEIEAGLAPAELLVGNLEPRRDLCDVRDTVRAYVDILERGVPGRPYNVCSGRALAIRELLEHLLDLSPATIAVITDPDRYRPNDLPVVIGDGSRIRDELGWEPRIPFERTARDVLEDWRLRVRKS